MRTLRLSLLGTVILALLAGLGGAVVAQEEEAAPAELPTGPALFEIVEDDGINVVATDPRMSGTLIERDFNLLEVPPNYHVATARGRVDNEAGAWECWANEYGSGYGGQFYLQSWCIGEGAYEGLSAIMFASSEADTHGLIYEGAPLREPPTD